MKGVKEAMGLIKERSIIVEVTEAIADSAADISLKYGLHALDALIYACAMTVNAELVTADPHFEGIEGVWLMK
jgi:predicted nucleic acid-binding protein